MGSPRLRLLLAVLLVLNLALLAAGWFASREQGRPSPQGTQPLLNADQIRIVRDEPEPTAPAPVPERVCLEWGPFPQDELLRAQASLAPAAFGERLWTAPVQAVANWWVYIPSRRTKEAADREVQRLNAAGIRDTYVVQELGDLHFAISLGIFRTEEAALRYAEGLRARGFGLATVGTRAQPIRLSALFLKDPEPAEAERILTLKAQFPGTDTRAAKCPPPIPLP